MTALTLLAVLLLVLQYSAHALLPAEKTSTVWGFLVGALLAGLLFDRVMFRTRPR